MEAMTEHTAEQVLENVQKYALRQIGFAAGQLSRLLLQVEREAADARRQLMDGLRINGSHDFGPIGHQTPFDLVNYNRQLQDAIDMAAGTGCTEKQVVAAVKSDLR